MRYKEYVMRSFLEVTFSDAVYRLDMEYIKERHRSYMAALEERAAARAELFLQDDKYLISWVDINIRWDEIRGRVEKVKEGSFNTIWQQGSDWPYAEKRLIF